VLQALLQRFGSASLGFGKALPKNKETIRFVISLLRSGALQGAELRLIKSAQPPIPP
jgi:hypothetical protein